MENSMKLLDAELDDPGRVCRQLGTLLRRQAEAVFRILPGADDVDVGHVCSFLPDGWLPTGIAPMARATPVLEAITNRGLQAPVLELDGSGRMGGYASPLLVRQAQAVFRVLPGADDIDVGHVSLLSA
jgi:hypothetical protein